MPNWCDNYLQINASPDAIQAILSKAKGPECPDSEKIVEFSFLPFVADSLPENYQEVSYETNLSVLGCKWFPTNLHLDSDSDWVTVSFETPWGPSDKATRLLAKWLKELDPNFKLAHSYEEPGMGFCGLISINGEGEIEREGDRCEIECEEVSESPDEDLEYLCKAFEITIPEIRKLAEDWKETTDYLCVYPEFFQGYGHAEFAIYLPVRPK